MGIELTEKLKKWVKKTRNEKIKLMEENNRLINENKVFKNAILWAVTHNGLIPDNGVFEHLKETIIRYDNGKIDYFYTPGELIDRDKFTI